MAHISANTVLEMTISGGVFQVKSSYSTDHTIQDVVSFVTSAGDQVVSSLEALKSILLKHHINCEELAKTDSIRFAYLLCAITNRPHYTLIRDFMWPKIQSILGLLKCNCEPTVRNGCFIFVMYSEYMPTLRVNRITVRLDTFDLMDDPILASPWPPVESPQVG